MKLALGTAQFGGPYGVANSNGQIGYEEAARILNRAKLSGVVTLDTAVSYGKSESTLGNLGLCGWKVITKLPKIPASVQNVYDWVFTQVKASMQRLHVNTLSGVLLHNPEDIFTKQGPSYLKALQDLRELGIIEAIGYSIYSPLALDELTKCFWPDIVQAPFNVFDQRLLTSGWLDKLNSRGVLVHVRSVFLQGLLTMSPTLRPQYFSKWKDLLSNWDTLVIDLGVSPVKICLDFNSYFQQINKIIIGVDSVEQLQQILREYSSENCYNLESFASEDLDLIEPFRWCIR